MDKQKFKVSIQAKLTANGAKLSMARSLLPHQAVLYPTSAKADLTKRQTSSGTHIDRSRPKRHAVAVVSDEFSKSFPCAAILPGITQCDRGTIIRGYNGCDDKGLVGHLLLIGKPLCQPDHFDNRFLRWRVPSWAEHGPSGTQRGIRRNPRLSRPR
jgi:hypothetical protein